jgi:hypothetical protein
LRKAATRSQQVRGGAKKHRKGAAISEIGSVAWIRELATPYLKGYRPVAAKNRGLRGYWFIASAMPQREERSGSRGKPPVSRPAAGFFVGYLIDGQGFSSLDPQPPECLVFSWVHPLKSPLHRRLVGESGSLVRNTFEYIRWLTHRPPRFVFHEDDLPTLTRHQSMRDWPADKYTHLSRNFFIETLAWLVRSGLARKLLEETG